MDRDKDTKFSKRINLFVLVPGHKHARTPAHTTTTHTHTHLKSPFSTKILRQDFYARVFEKKQKQIVKYFQTDTDISKANKWELLSDNKGKSHFYKDMKELRGSGAIAGQKRGKHSKSLQDMQTRQTSHEPKPKGKKR